jgi:two-component system sensor histidine kinase VicK
MPAYRFLEGGGEMGALIRSFDWSETSMGDPGSWPQSLKTTLSIVLHAKFPMFLWWGPELLCFYNDAYRPSLGQDGKHPGILGRPAPEAWPEIWPVIKPLIDQVLGGGESTWSEDQLIPIYRNGRLEDVYWTFSYSPVNDESGNIAGVFVTCTETTGKIQAIKDIQSSKDDLDFALDAAELGTFDLDPATNKFKGNARLKEWFGLAPQEEIPLPLAIEAIAGKDRERVMEAIQRALQYASGGYYDIEYTIINPKNNKERLVRAVGKALFDEDHVAWRFSGTVQDITLETTARKAFEDTYQRLEIALDAGKLGSYDINLDTGLMVCSDQCKLNYGWPVDKPLNYHDMLNMVKPEYEEYVRDQVRNAITQHNSYHTEYMITWPDGSSHWMSSSGIPHYNGEGKVTRIVGVTYDITERKIDEQRKNDFIGMVSHELKTPLTSLKGYVQILHAKARKQDDDFAVNALSKVETQVNKMSAMINSFLNVSRLESGKIHLDKQEFDLYNLLKDTVEETILINPSHQIALAPYEPIIVFADKDKIEHVISNLLSNAIKYSARGSNIEVKCEITGDAVMVSVKDKGVGIKPHDIERLFERYYRVESNEIKHISGFGIGLYLSSEIIRRHAGKIWVDSEFDEGSTFYFTLPLSAGS